MRGAEVGEELEPVGAGQREVEQQQARIGMLVDQPAAGLRRGGVEHLRRRSSSWPRTWRSASRISGWSSTTRILTRRGGVGRRAAATPAARGTASESDAGIMGSAGRMMVRAMVATPTEKTIPPAD